MRIMNTLFVTAMLGASVSTAQADGVFDKVFGGAKSAANFETLMSHVPADTAYILGNKNPIPNDVMDFHIKRAQEMLDMISNMNEKEDSDASDKEATAEDFFKALMNNLSDKMTAGKIEDTGLTLEATSVVYGYKMFPVVRLSFADKDKIMASIKQAEEKSGFKVTLSKCGEFDCFIAPESTRDKQSAAVVIADSHLAASFFPLKEKADIIDHLSGKISPNNPYSLKKWDTFLEGNSYGGYGDGYVNLQKVYETFKPSMTEDMGEGCTAVFGIHAKNVPEITFGIKSLSTKKMDYELVVNTSAGVSEVLQSLANKTNISKRIDNPIFDMALNLNIIKLRDALTQYSNFIVQAGKDNNCKAIDEEEVRKSMGGVMMVMNMGLTQIKSLYASITSVDIGERMAPKNIEAYVSVGSDDPKGLLQMIGMMVPPLSKLEIPEDGKPVAVPADAIPQRGMPVPPLWLSRSKDSLNIMVGNEKPSFTEYASKVPEIMSSTLDGKRYYEKIAMVMKALPKPKNQKDKNGKELDEVMKKMGEMIGNYQQEIIADKRGLVINYHITY